MAEISSAGMSAVEVQSLISAAVPLPANSPPPSVADTSSTGTMQAMYALANHTHASKVRKLRAQTATDGTLAWAFSPPFAAGVTPIVLAVAETAPGVTDVVNAQIVNAPTSNGCSIIVNRTQRSVVSLIGLTVLSVPSNPGVTWVHAVAVEP